MIRRREFISLLGGAAAGWPRGALGQQGERVRRVGVLHGIASGDPEAADRMAAFLRGLETLNWKSGQNIVIHERWTAAETKLIHANAQELVALRPDVIVAHSARVFAAVRQVADTTPLVFIAVNDPVGQGLVQSLSRPGGNSTGFSLFEYSIVSKMLEALKEITPGIARVMLIANSDNPSVGFYKQLFEVASRSLAIIPVMTLVRDRSDIERNLAALARQTDIGLLLPPDITTDSHRQLLAELTAQHRLPAVYWHRGYAKAGGLMSYGVEVADLYQRAATYVDKILRGAQPADLPVQQPDKFQLVLNLKTARALGITVPATLLARADEVIE